MQPADFERHARHPINDDADYTSYLDEFRRGDDQLLFIHLTFNKVSPRVFSRVMRDWRSLRAVVPAPICALGRDDDDKFNRFVTRCGFQHVQDIPCTDDRTRRLFVSLKDCNDG